MELGVFNAVFKGMSLEDILIFLSSKNIKYVELGCGGFSETEQINVSKLNNDEKYFNEFVDLLKKYDITISALSVHGNCVHPNKKIADKFQNDFENTCILAQKLNIKTIITFSGCPGDCENSKYPNWVTCYWPTDFVKVLDYQWNEVLIPYWKKATQFAKQYGVEKIALELHPGFSCYNPETLIKLRSAVGEMIGVNFDPSHMVWQGIDCSQAILELKDCIFHVHAKDVKINKYNVAKNGVLDTKDFADEVNRSWLFRSVGYGNDNSFWKDFFSTLNLIGYNGVISIEHEDSLLDGIEGLEKAISYLKDIIPKNEKPSNIWWNK